jgi:hypothetical protein
MEQRVLSVTLYAAMRGLLSVTPFGARMKFFRRAYFVDIYAWNAELTAFQVQAVSRLAAQHDEITRLHAALISGGVVRSLPTGRGSQ